jgi:hypothetical protein
LQKSSNYSKKGTAVPAYTWDFDRSKLINKARRGEVTLIIGAGVSRAFGIPDWDNLGRRIWVRAFGDAPSPWDSSHDHSPLRLPQFLPIVFERAAEVLNEDESSGFVSALRDALYAEVKVLPKVEDAMNSTDSLVVLARTLAKEYLRGGGRRIQRVVTFNVDSLLETMTNRLIPGEPTRRPRAVRTISCASQEPRLSSGLRRQEREPGSRPIPIYHIHGNIPQNPGVWYARYYEHRLVFTDSEYWTSSSSVLSFPNRTMGAALSDSACVFIGASMTDINILRWLALHNADYENDRRERELRADPEIVQRNEERRRSRPGTHITIRGYESRHFWIRPTSDDPSGFLSDFLRRRGVLSVTIDDWQGPSFSKLIEECFPA